MKDIAVDVAVFMMRYSTYTDFSGLVERIRQHIGFKTCRVMLDSDNKICAVCLWNISHDGQTADVLDLVIREDYRSNGMMRRILIDGRKVWPVKYLRYNRDYTEDGHDRWAKAKTINVERFLRRNNGTFTS